MSFSNIWITVFRFATTQPTNVSCSLCQACNRNRSDNVRKVLGAIPFTQMQDIISSKFFSNPPIHYPPHHTGDSRKRTSRIELKRLPSFPSQYWALNQSPRNPVILYPFPANYPPGGGTGRRAGSSRRC